MEQHFTRFPRFRRTRGRNSKYAHLELLSTHFSWCMAWSNYEWHQHNTHHRRTKHTRAAQGHDSQTAYHETSHSLTTRFAKFTHTHFALTHLPTLTLDLDCEANDGKERDSSAQDDLLRLPRTQFYKNLCESFIYPNLSLRDDLLLPTNTATRI